MQMSGARGQVASSDDCWGPRQGLLTTLPFVVGLLFMPPPFLGCRGACKGCGSYAVPIQDCLPAAVSSERPLLNMQCGIGIDFGTTNSALAIAAPGQPVRFAVFQLHGSPVDVFRSMLFFEADRPLVKGRPAADAGPAAIERYLESGGDGRLMQSLKSFVANQNPPVTQVFGHTYRLEDLIATMVRGLYEKALPDMGGQVPVAVVAGRPVRFANSAGPEMDSAAEARLRNAFRLAGTEQVDFLFEPIAAALHYEQQLEAPSVVLIADFGGGTSDFSLLKLGPGTQGLPPSERVLASAGIGIGGDTLDGRIVDHAVAPSLGKGAEYRTATGRTMPVPAWPFHRLRRWNELSILKSRKNMEMLYDLNRHGVGDSGIDALIQIVEEDLGYALSRAVEATKIALTDAEEAEFRFEVGDVRLHQQVSRKEFEAWIGPELAEIEQTVGELLERTGGVAVERVFMTGGTARVPAVRRIFDGLFGAERVTAGDYHVSVAAGLAVAALQAQES